MKKRLANEARYYIEGLDTFRTRNGVTYRVLAQRLGVSISYLNDVAKGRRTMSTSQYDKLTHAICAETP